MLWSYILSPATLGTSRAASFICHDYQPLTIVECGYTLVSDLSPLKGMPLQDLHCDFKPERDAALLRSIKTLGTINGKPAAEFWKVASGK
jgi:hypothetical protein